MRSQNQLRSTEQQHAFKTQKSFTRTSQLLLYVHHVVGIISEAYPITNFNADATDAGFLAAGVGQEDVLGFEVSVDDTLAIKDTHGGCYLLEKHPQGVLPQNTLSWNNRKIKLLKYTHYIIIHILSLRCDTAATDTAYQQIS